MVTSTTTIEMVRIRGPQGEPIEVEQMNFNPVTEEWNEYTLDDGTVIRIKLVVTSIFRWNEPDPITGVPRFTVHSDNVISVKYSG